MSEQQQRVRLGIFVFVSLLGMAGLILFFGGARNWFRSHNNYTVVFAEAPGIAPGAAVRKSGVKIGEVSEVDLDPESGAVRVALRLNPKFIPNTGDQPTITRSLIVGDSSIDFFPKNLDKPEIGVPIPIGSEIRGVSPLNARQLLNQASDVIPEAQQSMNQIRLSLKKIEELAPQIQDTLQEFSALARTSREFIPELKKTNEDVRYFLKTGTRWIEDIGVTFRANEPKLMAAVESFTKTTDQFNKLLNAENQREFARILTNVGQASDRFDSITKETDQLLKESRRWFEMLVKDFRELIKPLQDAIEDARRIMVDVRKITQLLGEKSERIIGNLEIASDQFARTLMDVREILRAFAKAEGTLMRFLTDPSFFNNLNETVISFQKIMPRLDRILKDVEVFADKIARHPESIGIGGAIRGNSGIKEVPSVPGPTFKPK